MGHATADTVAWPIPTVDRAVVDLQSPQLRNASPVQDVNGVFGDFGRHEDAESAHVFLEQGGDRPVQPSFTEPDAWAQLPHVKRRAPSVDGLLEDGDARFGPQLAPEQER